MSNHPKTSTFQDVIETVEHFSLEDQEALLDILRKRLIEQRRLQLAQEAAEVRQDYQDGRVQFGTVDDFLAALDEEE